MLLKTVDLRPKEQGQLETLEYRVFAKRWRALTVAKSPLGTRGRGGSRAVTGQIPPAVLHEDPK
jgi:hypothetical protein